MRLKPDTLTAASAGDDAAVVGPENKGIAGVEGEVVRDSGVLVNIFAISLIKTVAPENVQVNLHSAVRGIAHFHNRERVIEAGPNRGV
jgi:hypothetical protein